MSVGGPAADLLPAVLAASLAALERRAGAPLRAVPVTGAGRAADRAASARVAAMVLAELGEPSGLGGHHDDGRPVWPPATTGSLAHGGAVAVGVAAPRPREGGGDGACWFGVDVEVSGALPAADAAAVLSAAELAAVRAHAAPDREATRVWSAKEAAFKAWCEATDGGLGTVDPVDLQVTLGPPDPTGVRAVRVDATGRLVAPTAPVGPLTGWCADTGDHVVVLVRSRASARTDHHGADGMASAAITMPSAAKATT